ncbi:MAG TPA: hypothetical protein VKV26_19595 [Dehalococcoidia bacterium]|nr:hypothetical protein [Dehalococcoidia bacterium]
MLERVQPRTLLRDSPTFGEPLTCPVCSAALRLDSWWISPHWLCASGHSYSNLNVLAAELREQRLSAFVRSKEASNPVE